MILQLKTARSSRSYLVFVSQLPFLLSLLLSLFLFFTSSCSNSDTPESVATDFINRCESIFEKRQLRNVKNLISERYQDPQGRSKEDISAIAAGYVFRNRNIHILSRLTSAVKNDDRIEMTILAAIAAMPINDASALPGLNADMYWFDVSLVEEKREWLVLKVSWRQAMLDDFLEKQN